MKRKRKIPKTYRIEEVLVQQSVAWSQKTGIPETRIVEFALREYLSKKR